MIRLSWRGLRRVLSGGLTLLLPMAAPPAFAQGHYALLTFLHTNDLHGRVLSGLDFEDNSRGGLARAATLVRRLKTTLPNVLFVDSGDLIHGSPVEFLHQGEAMIAAMNAAGVDVSCPGNHEFDWGQDAAQAAFRRAKFPWVSANIVEKATGQPFPPLQTYIVKEVEGVKIAFFGLTTLETVELEWPPFLSRVQFLDPLETAKRLVPELRRQSDLVVLVSHLGVKEDGILAAEVPGIDLIFGGHSHTTLNRHLEVAGTTIDQTGYYGQNLGRLDLVMKQDEAGKWQLDSLNGRGGKWWQTNAVRPLNLDFPTTALLPLGPDIPPDDAVVKAYQPFWDEWKAHEAEKAGDASKDITDTGAPGDTPMSRFLADRLREATKADLAIVDGKWRGGITAGEVPVSTIWNTMGGYTGQNILRFNVTGAQVRRFLEEWAKSPEGLAVGISGLTAAIDLKQPTGSRVTEILVAGKPLDDAHTYAFAGVMYVTRRFPSLMESAPLTVEGQVEWSRPLVIAAAKKLRHFSPDDQPRLVIR